MLIVAEQKALGREAVETTWMGMLALTRATARCAATWNAASSRPKAAIVRRIFETFASGLGLKAIAKRLTLDRVSPPAAPARHDGLTPPGWAPSTVRSILGRELYRGVVVWGRLKKRDAGGKVNRRRVLHALENHIRGRAPGGRDGVYEVPAVAWFAA